MTHEHHVTHIALLRHARTEWNETHRVQGWLDSPLTTQGREQARAWGAGLQSLPFDHLICSDLGRAKETARIIGAAIGLRAIEHQGLRERHFGTLEGRESSCLAACKNQDRPGGGGETPIEVRTRAMNAFASLSTHKARTVLAVTHHGVLNSLLSHLAGPAHPLREGRLLKSRRMHWIGVGNNIMGILQLNARILL